MGDPGLVALASGPLILVCLFAWAVGEALVLPVIPDVLLGLMALATPAALGLPLAVTLAGGVLGAVGLATLRRARPRLVDRLLALQPGLGESGMAAARARIDRLGPARAFAQVGPGLPLKAYVVALLDRRPSASTAELAGLALLNRVTRIVPVIVGFAVLGILIRPLGVPASVGIPIYLLGWTGYYVYFWWWRRDRWRTT